MIRAADMTALVEQVATAFAAAVEERAEELLAERMALPRVVPEDRLLLTAQEVAALIGLAEGTLANWRSQGGDIGPPFVKLGGMVRYRRTDLEAWIAAQE